MYYTWRVYYRKNTPIAIPSHPPHMKTMETMDWNVQMNLAKIPNASDYFIGNRRLEKYRAGLGKFYSVPGMETSMNIGAELANASILNEEGGKYRRGHPGVFREEC